jgi:hypothetical protein
VITNHICVSWRCTGGREGDTAAIAAEGSFQKCALFRLWAGGNPTSFVELGPIQEPSSALHSN